ncbi:MAG: rRNA (cytidine1920-2-O)/16S rRNA (cytidine1409-2-O)-methyltransferase [Candidatus Parcubacteria bacterium]|jgi:23S rRNA (cytidine1920-2'-O)/16S rRNA (cytidine1409-2'-O)-methyltransferase
MKKRLDIILTEKNLVKSRSQAADLIKRGKVTVDTKVVTKPSLLISPEAVTSLDTSEQFVSRGGIKLSHALKEFNVSIKNKTCIDIGSSTGGFTECLLKNEAFKVYAVDVGKDQFDPHLKEDPRVILMEQTDIRKASIPEKVDCIVIDVSFISLTHILPVLAPLLKEKTDIVCLIKPQFEVGRDRIPKNGVVTNENDRKEVVEHIKKTGESLGFVHKQTIESPILGGDGNKEFFIYFATI